MMIIPGWLIGLATFPGVIMHEAAHQLFCRLRHVAVFDVCYFRIGDPAGYVAHEPIEDFNTAFLVSTGPLVANSLLCMLFCLPVFVPVRIFNIENPWSYFFLWLGISIGMHAFPSTHDAEQLWGHARRAARSGNLLALVSFPLVILIHVANVARVFWFDAIYASFLGLGLPELLLRKLV